MKNHFINMRKTLIFIFVLGILTVAFANVKVNAAAQNLELLVCDPGEDASTQMRFTWHAKSNSSTFIYTLASDTEFKNATSVKLMGEYDNKESFDFDEIIFYNFEYELNDLTPNTKYIWKVKTVAAESSVHKFQTSGTAGNFGFMWVGDFHAYSGGCEVRMNYLEKMYNEFKNQGRDMSFVFSTGDIVSYGGLYLDWQVSESKLSLYKESVFASVPGNHDYYNSKNFSTSGSVYGTNRFFESRFNNPTNGIEGNSEDSSYWFIYNSVLFVCLDCLSITIKASSLEKQKAWFSSVVEANEGKYQYLIVAQHYPWLNAFTGELAGPYSSNRDVWKELFDKYNVDIALGGDYHVYYRTNKIYQDQVVGDETNNGTVYIGCPQIGDRYSDRDITDDPYPEYFATRYHNQAPTEDDGYGVLGCQSGCTYFTVTPEGITGELMDASLEIKDTYTLKAKRSVSWNDKKDNFESNIIFNYANNEAVVDFNYSYSDYIKEVKIYNGSELLTTYTPTTGSAPSVTLEGLQANKVYNLKLDVTFIDKTTESYDLIASTYPYYGTFDSFKANINGSKVNLAWNQNLQNDVIKNYNIYADGKLLSKVDASSTSYEINKSEVNLNTTFTIEGLSANNEVVFKKTANYSVFGDSNFDGTVDASDLTYLLQEFRASYSFSGNEIRLLDLNNDGTVDIGDALVLRQYNKGEVTDLNNEYFTVTVIDNNGNIVNKQKVQYGKDAELGDITDASFLYYTSNGKYITSDTIIKTIYTK